MKSMIDIFLMDCISNDTKIKIIKRLGTAINYQYTANMTEPLVYELVLALDPNNEIKNDAHYLEYL